VIEKVLEYINKAGKRRGERIWKKGLSRKGEGTEKKF
jgi:hypothetical protein